MAGLRIPPITGKPAPGRTGQAASRGNAGSGRARERRHILFTMPGWHEEAGGTMLPKQIARTLVERGHKVSVIVARTSGARRTAKGAFDVQESSDSGVHLFFIDHPGDFKYNLENPEVEMDDPRMRRIMVTLVAGSRPDLIHYHSLHNFSLGAPRTVHQMGIPSIYTSHNYWPICPRMYLLKPDTSVCEGPSADGGRCASCIGQIEKKERFKERADLSRRILNSSIDRHVTVSQRVRQIFLNNAFEPSCIHVLPLQCLTADRVWSQLGKHRSASSTLELPLQVGFLGNLFAWKGAHVLVEAMQAFRRHQVECHIFGDGHPSHVRLLRQIDQHGLTRFHGGYSPSRLPDILSRLHVAVIPSICEETGGLVALEALAGRVPVVASRIGGLPELVRDGMNGFLFTPGHAGELENIINRFIRDPSLLGNLQRRILPPTGFDRYVDDLTAHYEAAIVSHHDSSPQGACVPRH